MILKKSKPAIYKLDNIRISRGEKTLKEFNWEWHDLNELSTVTKLSCEQLLFNYLEILKGKWGKTNNINEFKLAMITILRGIQGKALCDLHWCSKRFLFKKSYIFPRKIDGILKRQTFVPAGWGLAVIDEINKKQKDLYQLIDETNRGFERSENIFLKVDYMNSPKKQTIKKGGN